MKLARRNDEEGGSRGYVWVTSADSYRMRGIVSHGREKNGEGCHAPCGKLSSNPRRKAVLFLLLLQGCRFKGDKEGGKKGYAFMKADYVYFLAVINLYILKCNCIV